MKKFTLSKNNVKLAIVLGLSAIIIVAFLLISTSISGGKSQLTEAIEGGESTVTAIDRGHEAITKFANDQKAIAEDLLKTAQESQGFADSKLTYAQNTKDDFVLNMVNNFRFLLSASGVAIQGVNNLLTISDDLEETLNYYQQGAYEEAADKAAVCLSTLVPLVEQFKMRNQSLGNINYHYMASGQKDKVKYAVTQFEDSMAIYLEYIDLLDTIKSGTDYLEKMKEMDDLFDQLQHAIANKDYDSARKLMDEIANKTDLLKDPIYQDIASKAVNLNPEFLDGLSSNIAEDLRSQLKDLNALEGFKNYLSSLEKYLEASEFMEQDNPEAAQSSINMGLSLLGQGQGLPADLQRYYAALQGAFNSLMMQIKGKPPQG